MKDKVNLQLDLVGRAINWVEDTESMKGSKGASAYLNLVNARRNLRKKQFALEGNPAAALYGESQAGKSYLVSSLLSVGEGQFKLQDENGREYDFKKEINPRGNETESTSVATRFTTNYVSINSSYPIVARLLSPTDLIIIICEAYYNNLRVSNLLSYDELKNQIETIETRYSNSKKCQDFITEDQIFDIQEYFSDNFSKLAFNNLNDSKFFETISRISNRIPIQDWPMVYSILWNYNEQLTKLFTSLLNEHEKLGFTQEVFLPIDAVLRDNGTLLDVTRLDEIYRPHQGQEPNYKKDTDLLFLDLDGNQQQLSFSKPFLCALCLELIFILPKELIQKKPFLAHTDLLDFPGTRRPESTNDKEISDTSLTTLLRRGRVDYLFNKYSNNERINSLLFCQNHKQSGQSVIPEKLNRWIGNMIGKTPEEREQFKAEVPPLFIISTWFNKDLEFADDINEGNTYKLNERWEQRFVKTLSNEIIRVSDYNWLKNWTSTNPNFQNIFLLRDFDKSSDSGGNSHLFKGFNEFGSETEEILPSKFPAFKEELKESFLNFGFVTEHFSNPEISWDEATGINKDGTDLIIQKLNQSALNINSARLDKFHRELKLINTSVLTFLSDFYNSTDKAENLKKSVRSAGHIQIKLDVTFGKDPYFFGILMKELMLKSSDVFNLFLEKIRDIERRDVVNLDRYSMVRIRVPKLDPAASFEENLQHLGKFYEKDNLDECRELFEKEFGFDLNELFFANRERVINFSQVLANELEQHWFNNWMPKSLNNLSASLPTETVSAIEEILQMFQGLYKKLKMTDVLAAKIRRYVDGYRSIEEVYEMISDICAELVNTFINTVGYAFYAESNKNDLAKATQNITELRWEHPELEFDNNSKSQVALLITQMGNLPELLNQNPLPISELKALPNYSNYIIWSDLLKAGFVTSSGIPNYDPVANEKLGLILRGFETIDF